MHMIFFRGLLTTAHDVMDDIYKFMTGDLIHIIFRMEYHQLSSAQKV